MGTEYPRAVSVLGDLASLDDSSTLIAGGIAQAQRAVELAERIDGPEHPELARLLCILAVLDRQKGDYAAATTCLDRALEIRQKTLSKFHPDLAVTLEAYAAVLRAMTPPQIDRADKMEARAKDIRPSTPRKTGCRKRRWDQGPGEDVAGNSRAGVACNRHSRGSLTLAR